MMSVTRYGQLSAVTYRKDWAKKQRFDVARRLRAPRKKKLALLLPAHNEELIIQTTLRSAINAGQAKEDIFVVDDGSKDLTRSEAIKMLGKRQVLSVEHSGKAGAVHKAIKHFNIEDRYSWIHIADSDSVFGPDYFKIYRKGLVGNQYVAAVGFVQSLRGNWICRYRAFSYTFGQHVIRRVQSWLGMISVMPGPITSYRTDIIKHLDFFTGSLTEDFDITLQIHRQKLGKIKYIPDAVNFTQDPQTIGDFWKQTLRWYRGFFQGVAKYKIGSKTQRIDVSIMYQLMETLLYILQVWILLPILLIATNNWKFVWAVFVGDMIVLGIIGVYSAAMALRPSILISLPLFYILRNIELIAYVKTFFEVIVFKRFPDKGQIGWATTGRRYALSEKALQDTTAA